MLEKVAAMPITRWNYKHEPQHLQHIGPMAQDFKAAFGLNGIDDTIINSVDVQGVALAAIKGLYQQNLSLSLRSQIPSTRNQSLEAKLAHLQASLKALETAFSSLKVQAKQ